MTIHRTLEERLADFKGAQAALLFGSGYLANTGTVAALGGPGEVVFSDELNHASIIDGCRLSRSEVFVYRHRDTEHLEWGLRRAGARASLIVTDGVFSMDGDIAPLPDLHELAGRHGCMLMVDEAHGTGALGPGGRGSVAAAGLQGRWTWWWERSERRSAATAPTCARPRQVAELPPQHGPALHLLHRAAAALGRSRAGRPRDPARAPRHRRAACGVTRATLREALGAYGLDLGDSRTQIVPVLVGEAGRAMSLCEHALERGVFAQAIRPPTVPDGTSRLRLAVMATHSADELRGRGPGDRAGRTGGGHRPGAGRTGVDRRARPDRPGGVARPS